MWKVLSLLGLWAAVLSTPAAAQDWMHYGGDAGGSHYSVLDQINTGNVEQLKQAWVYRTGDMDRPDMQVRFSGFHVTPILLPEAAGRHLVLCSAYSKVIALDPATGEERWAYDPDIEIGRPGTSYKCRGLTVWQDPEAEDNASCKWRILSNTNDRRLIALDARTGTPCPDFGENGEVNVEPLIEAAVPATDTKAVQTYTPPVVVGDTVVIGSTTNSKSRRSSAPNGEVRAFDVRSGELKWIFDPIPRDRTNPAAQDWTDEAIENTGGANVWSMMSVDEDRDLVFLPTSSASPDFYGGTRPGDNLYANSVVALRGSTGEVVWHFQLVHHDVWNFDTPAQPMLVDVEKDGQKIPAVIQVTKQGFVFVFHRETGEPIFKVEEKPVPTDGVPGEVLSPTQPFPTELPALVPQEISPDDAWGVGFYDRSQCKKKIEESRHGSIYTPLTTQGTVLYPQTGGGMNWGGAAFDATRNLLITPVTRIPFYIRLVPVSELDPNTPRAPNAGMAFGPPGAIEGTPYAVEQKPLMSPFMTPCTAPPWGTIVALDLTTRKVKWETTLGTIAKFTPGAELPLKYGMPSAGGPLMTAGGLVFIGAAPDEKFRAFDSETGEELLALDIPTSAMANPMTYEVDGKQYVVVAAGGHAFLYPQKMGDWLIAFALPEAN